MADLVACILYQAGLGVVVFHFGTSKEETGFQAILFAFFILRRLKSPLLQSQFISVKTEQHVKGRAIKA